MTSICNDCGEKFSDSGLGHHWRQSSCEQPKLSKSQNEIITGLLMGDGNIESREGGSIFSVSMINEEFIAWLDNEVLSNLTTGYSLSVTAEKSAKSARESGFRPDALTENYHDVYRLRTRTLSDLDKFKSWYQSGEKVYPDMSITSTILKMWYCSDGGLSAGEVGRNQIQIRCSNESDRIQNLVKLFNEIGFNPTVTNNRTRITFTSDETEDFLEWIGEPAPGFEYKWESQSQEEYLTEKRKVYNG